ncbi:hypothetical protein J2Y69_000907 [Microbacterium resistens]|uniref:Lipoprotein n=1 Tax=Microbacterium resistens TaxID=156977 RepID=A0ABU1S9P7_9MICO|nr:hypothetical protein [Microbacterium resistens]MDR6866315.1 hypothetical protein [Microbacterium resistens]
MRRLAAPLALTVLLLSGCAGAPGAVPLPTDAAEGPTPSTTPSATPTSTAPASPQPTGTPTAPPVEFTADQLVELCVERTVPYFKDPELNLRTEEAQVLRREIDPPWMVHIPGTGSKAPEVAALCVIGGTPDVPDVYIAVASLPLTEKQFQHVLVSNEPFFRLAE